MEKKSTRSYWMFRHGQLVSQFGNSCFAAATTLWLTFNQDHSVVVAWISSIPLFISILLGPFVGTIVDAFNSRKLLILIDGIGAILSLILAFIYWYAEKATSVLFIGLVVISIGHAIFSIFYFSILEKMYAEFANTPDERLSLRAQTATSTQLVSLLSPSIAAMLVKFLGPAFTLILDAFTYFYGAVTARISSSAAPNDVCTESSQKHLSEKLESTMERMWIDTKAGWLFIYKHGTLRNAILTFMGINLFTGSFGLLLGFFIKQKLKLSMTAVPLIMIPSSLFGIYFATKAQLIEEKIKKFNISTIELGIGALTIAYLLLFFVQNIFSVIFFTVIFSAVGMIINLVFMNDLQELVPSELQGRVFSSVVILAQITTPFSNLLTSIFIDYNRYGISSAILFSITGLIFLFFRRYLF